MALITSGAPCARTSHLHINNIPADRLENFTQPITTAGIPRLQTKDVTWVSQCNLEWHCYAHLYFPAPLTEEEGLSYAILENPTMHTASLGLYFHAGTASIQQHKRAVITSRTGQPIAHMLDLHTAVRDSSSIPRTTQIAIARDVADSLFLSVSGTTEGIAKKHLVSRAEVSRIYSDLHHHHLKQA